MQGVTRQSLLQLAKDLEFEAAEQKVSLRLRVNLLSVLPAVEVNETSGGDAIDEPVRPVFVCPHCGARMIVLETFERGQSISAPPSIAEVPLIHVLYVECMSN